MYKTIQVTDSDSYEVACYIALMAGFPKGSKCWEFGKVWSKRNPGSANHTAEPDIGGVSVWHRDTVGIYGDPDDRDNVAYIMEAKPDIRVKHLGENVYEVLFTEKVPVEYVEKVSDEQIRSTLEKSFLT